MVRKYLTRKLVLAALAIFAAATFSHAQREGFGGGRPGGPEGPGGFGPRIAQELGLTDAQKQQIQNYLQDARSQMEVLRNDTTLTQEQRREQARSIRENTQARLKSVLTPDQQARAEQLRKDAQAKMQQRREQAVDRRLERMTGELGLNSSQAAAIKSLNEQARTQARSIRENSTLSQEQKIQQLQALRESTRNQIKAHLTGEQQARLDQLMQQRREQFEQRRGGSGRRRGPGRGFSGPLGISL